MCLPTKRRTQFPHSWIWAAFHALFWPTWHSESDTVWNPGLRFKILRTLRLKSLQLCPTAMLSNPAIWCRMRNHVGQRWSIPAEAILDQPTPSLPGSWTQTNEQTQPKPEEPPSWAQSKSLTCRTIYLNCCFKTLAFEVVCYVAKVNWCPSTKMIYNLWSNDNVLPIKRPVQDCYSHLAQNHAFRQEDKVLEQKEKFCHKATAFIL